VRGARGNSRPYREVPNLGDGDFEAEYLRALALASIESASPQATAHPELEGGAKCAAATFALSSAETGPV
jgi:hypothetical protein